jgi:hypothetical protein
VIVDSPGRYQRRHGGKGEQAAGAPVAVAQATTLTQGQSEGPTQ